MWKEFRGGTGDCGSPVKALPACFAATSPVRGDFCGLRPRWRAAVKNRGGSGALGGAQRAPPVCFANPLLRLFAPQGQTLFATPVSLRSTVAPDSQPRTTSQQRQLSLPAFFCCQKKAASREPAVYPLADTLKNTRYPCAHPRFPVPWIPLTLHLRGACRRAG